MIKYHKATASSKAARRLEIAIEQWGGSQRVAAKKERPKNPSVREPKKPSVWKARKSSARKSSNKSKKS